MHLHTRKRMHEERYRPSVDLEEDGQHLAKMHPCRHTEIDTDTAEFHSSRLAAPTADAVTNYNLRAKSFAEQQAVLSLRQLSQIEVPHSNVSGDSIEELTNALITDAPPDVVQAIQRDELTALMNLQSLIAKRISVVSRGEPPPELNGTRTSEARRDSDDSMDTIS